MTAAATDIVIIGAAGLAKELATLIDDVNAASDAPPWRLLGYIDADRSRVGELHGGYPLLGSDDDLLAWGAPVAAAFGIGWPARLAAAHAALSAATHIAYPAIVHPTAVVHPGRVTLEEGVVATAGVVITTDVVVGARTFLNLQTAIGHDARIGVDCVLNVGVRVSGGVTLGDRCLVGSGAVILQGLTIGADAVVGAGAVVTRDVAAGETVAGVPARPLAAKGGP
jgi:sugar O-acyltransferase (sialic acid O-acetyltransferase NeuD family)